MKSTLLPLLGAASFSLQAPVEGINSISQSTVNTQSGQPFFTKVGVADCAIEGSAGRNSTSRYYNFQNVPDVLACQNQCLYYGGCVMYSWEPAASAPYQCTLYTAIGNEIVNATTFTESVVRGSTGIFWSDRTLRDGSYVCYSTASFTAPGTISPRTEDIVEKPSPTVTAPLAIITNFNITNCHVEGLPGNITYYGIGQKHEKNPLLCEESVSLQLLPF
ncbi:hypothetical protein BGZ60DRAFT_155211 [Tricladium varicosporioides]|nr:hypothetical protein BGZ60DRAFT_155211 [Hymenoscyphus varicosporioides]